MIQLTRHNSKETFFIIPGERVKCKFYNGNQEIGNLTNLTDSTFELNNKTFSIDSLKAIAKRKRGALMLILLVEGAGLALIFTGHVKTQTELYLLATAQTLILIRPVYNYLMRDRRKWDIKTNYVFDSKNDKN
jgi:hypothetical protein